jgi:selenocysteine lyase/cysteine desulfurase
VQSWFDDLGACACDVFGTANFLNFIPWAAALEYLLAQDVEATAGHDQALVEQLIGRLDDSGYRVISPTAPVSGRRSSSSALLTPGITRRSASA